MFPDIIFKMLQILPILFRSFPRVIQNLFSENLSIVHIFTTFFKISNHFFVISRIFQTFS